MRRWVKLHNLVSGIPLLLQLPANASRQVADDGSSAWVPVTYVGIQGVEQSMGDFSPSLSTALPFS